MGWNTQPTRQVIMEGARVPPENLMGAEGEGFKIAMAGLDGGRLNIGACSLGGGEAALAKALAYMRDARRSAADRRFPGAAIPSRRHRNVAGGGAFSALARRRRPGRQGARRDAPLRHGQEGGDRRRL